VLVVVRLGGSGDGQGELEEADEGQERARDHVVHGHLRPAGPEAALLIGDDPTAREDEAAPEGEAENADYDVENAHKTGLPVSATRHSCQCGR